MPFLSHLFLCMLETPVFNFLWNLSDIFFRAGKENWQNLTLQEYLKVVDAADYNRKVTLKIPRENVVLRAILCFMSF